MQKVLDMVNRNNDNYHINNETLTKEQKMKKPKWAKGLTSKDLKHIAEVSATGRASLRVAKDNANNDMCMECRHIGNVLKNRGLIK